MREIDALGGEMGKVIDRTFIQSKMLNRSKGPAVHSLRAQADKSAYSRAMRQVLQEQENLDIRQMEVTDILTDRSESGKEDRDRGTDVFRRYLSMQSGCFVYGNVFACALHLWGREYADRSKRTAGGKLSYREFKISRN